MSVKCALSSGRNLLLQLPRQQRSTCRLPQQRRTVYSVTSAANEQLESSYDEWETNIQNILAKAYKYVGRPVNKIAIHWLDDVAFQRCIRRVPDSHSGTQLHSVIRQARHINHQGIIASLIFQLNAPSRNNRCGQTKLTELIDLTNAATYRLQYDVSHDKHLGENWIPYVEEYMLSAVHCSLSTIRNKSIKERFKHAIKGPTVAQLLTYRNRTGVLLPIPGFLHFNDWEHRHCLLQANLMAHLAREMLCHDNNVAEKTCNEGYVFGKNFTLAMQLYKEMYRFVTYDGSTRRRQFDLTSLPVVSHLQRSPQPLLHYIHDEQRKLDYSLIHSEITCGPSISEVRSHLQRLTESCLMSLSHFEDSKPRQILKKIVSDLSSTSF